MGERPELTIPRRATYRLDVSGRDETALNVPVFPGLAGPLENRWLAR